MMITRPRAKALTCAAVLVAALAGCGGSTQKPAALGTSTTPATPPTAPATSDTATTAAPTTAPTTSAPPAAGDYAAFPGFTLPADLKVVIDPAASTGDPVKDKILADNVQVLRASGVVLNITGSFDSPGVTTYLAESMRGVDGAEAAKYHASGKTITGSLRYYNRRVVALDSQGARVIACEDGRQAFDKDVKTGKADPASADGIVAIVTMVAKNSAGVWQAQLLSKERNSALCTAP